MWYVTNLLYAFLQALVRAPWSVIAMSVVQHGTDSRHLVDVESWKGSD